MNRECYHCHEIKSIDKFVKAKKQKGGYGFVCKRCASIVTMEWQKRHPDRLIAARKAYKQSAKWKAARWRRRTRRKFRNRIMAVLLDPSVKPVTGRRASKHLRFRLRVLMRDGFKCVYCGRHPPEIALEVDHIIPRALGGKNEMGNCQTLCWECNRGKGAMLVN